MRPSDEKFTNSKNFELNTEKERKDLTDFEHFKEDGRGGSWLGDQYMKTINNDPTKLTAEALKNGIVKH